MQNQNLLRPGRQGQRRGRRGEDNHEEPTTTTTTIVLVAEEGAGEQDSSEEAPLLSLVLSSKSNDRMEEEEEAGGDEDKDKPPPSSSVVQGKGDIDIDIDIDIDNDEDEDELMGSEEEEKKEGGIHREEEEEKHSEAQAATGRIASSTSSSSSSSTSTSPSPSTSSNDDDDEKKEDDSVTTTATITTTTTREEEGRRRDIVETPSAVATTTTTTMGGLLDERTVPGDHREHEEEQAAAVAIGSVVAATPTPRSVRSLSLSFSSSSSGTSADEEEDNKEESSSRTPTTTTCSEDGKGRAAAVTISSVSSCQEVAAASTATGRGGIVEGVGGEEGSYRDVGGRRRSSASTHILFPQISFSTNGSGNEEAEEIGTGTEVVGSTSSVEDEDGDKDNNEDTTSPTPTHTPLCSDEGNGTTPTTTTALTISSSSLSSKEEAAASTGRGGENYGGRDGGNNNNTHEEDVVGVEGGTTTALPLLPSSPPSLLSHGNGDGDTTTSLLDACRRIDPTKIIFPKASISNSGSGNEEEEEEIVGAGATATAPALELVPRDTTTSLLDACRRIDPTQIIFAKASFSNSGSGNEEEEIVGVGATATALGDTTPTPTTKSDNDEKGSAKTEKESSNGRNQSREDMKRRSVDDFLTDTPGTNIDIDGMFCQVCSSVESIDDDPIVLCDGCNLGFHKHCYSIVEDVEESDEPWFCDPCKYRSITSPSTTAEIVCTYCKQRGGALLNVGNVWQHPMCAVFSSKITCTTCSSCSLHGAVQCEKCQDAIHPYCAVGAGWTIVYAKPFTNRSSQILCSKHGKYVVQSSGVRIIRSMNDEMEVLPIVVEDPGIAAEPPAGVRDESTSHESHDEPPEDEEYLQAMVEQAVSLEESSTHDPQEYDDVHVPALVVVPIAEAPEAALEEDNSIHERPEDHGHVQAPEVAPVVVAPGNAAIGGNEPEVQVVEAVYIASMGRSTNKRKKQQKYPNGTRITMHFNDDDDDRYPYYLGFEGEHKDGIIVGYDNFNSCDRDMGICQQWTYLVRFSMTKKDNDDDSTKNASSWLELLPQSKLYNNLSENNAWYLVKKHFGILIEEQDGNDVDEEDGNMLIDEDDFNRARILRGCKRFIADTTATIGGGSHAIDWNTFLIDLQRVPKLASINILADKNYYDWSLNDYEEEEELSVLFLAIITGCPNIVIENLLKLNSTAIDRHYIGCYVYNSFYEDWMLANPEVFLTIDPEILRLLLQKTKNEEGICFGRDEEYGSAEEEYGLAPILRFLQRHHRDQASITSYSDRSTITISPHVKVILEENSYAVSKLLGEEFYNEKSVLSSIVDDGEGVGGSVLSSEVLRFALECAAKKRETCFFNTLIEWSGGEDHDYFTGSLMDVMFDYIGDNCYRFREYMAVYMNEQNFDSLALVNCVLDVLPKKNKMYQWKSFWKYFQYDEWGEEDTVTVSSRHPVFTAIRIECQYEIISDIVQKDPSILESLDNYESLPIFGLVAATRTYKDYIHPKNGYACSFKKYDNHVQDKKKQAIVCGTCTKQKSGVWNCEKCTKENPLIKKMCMVCRAKRTVRSDGSHGSSDQHYNNDLDATYELLRMNPAVIGNLLFSAPPPPSPPPPLPINNDKKNRKRFSSIFNNAPHCASKRVKTSSSKINSGSSSSSSKKNNNLRMRLGENSVTKRIGRNTNNLRMRLGKRG